MSTDRLTEVLNYLSAMSRDIGAFRSETASRFDAIEVRLDRLEARMDKLEGRMDRLEGQVGKLEARVDNLEARVDRFEASMVARFEAMNVKFDDFRSDVRRLNRKFDLVAEDSTELRSDYHDMNKRVDALERKTGILE